MVEKVLLKLSFSVFEFLLKKRIDTIASIKAGIPRNTDANKAI